MDGRDTSDDIDLSDRRVVALLAATVEFVTGDAATITAVNQLPIPEGSSGAALSRVDVTYTTRHVASASIGLVLKMCSDIELAVLLRLQAAHPRHTPYIQSSPIRASDQTLTCLQDLGANYRPDSLSEISADLQQNEAQALADIHTQNLDTELDWRCRRRAVNTTPGQSRNSSSALPGRQRWRTRGSVSASPPPSMWLSRRRRRLSRR